MSKQAKSLWDFGELFPPEQTRRVLTVAELTGNVRRLLEQQIGTVWVTGEITNLRAQSSGHVYFSLKDASAQLSCVLFRGESVSHRGELRDGLKVVLQGEMTVYEARGQYQLIVHAVELQGVGALQLAFERLKQKLAAEGLFAPERKRPLPAYPQRIGLVTSPTGAAIRDVLHVIHRRQPSLEIILAPCRVQGQGAAQEIANAIRLLNEFRHGARTDTSQSTIRNPQSEIDLILLTRGGGSLEDLWAFNEEIVARSIAASAIPVVSAVGHEIDFTIADFVADLRAATPSAAAELITENAYASRELVAGVFPRMRQLVCARLDLEKENFVSLARRLSRTHPRRQLDERLQYLDDLVTSLLRTTRQLCHQQRERWQFLRRRLLLVRPTVLLAQYQHDARGLGRRLREASRHRLSEQRSRFVGLDARLRLLSPDNVLARGYSITRDSVNGQVIRDAQALSAGQSLRTRLNRGEVISTVEKVSGAAG